MYFLKLVLPILLTGVLIFQCSPEDSIPEKQAIRQLIAANTEIVEWQNQQLSLAVNEILANPGRTNFGTDLTRLLRSIEWRKSALSEQLEQQRRYFESGYEDRQDTAGINRQYERFRDTVLMDVQSFLATHAQALMLSDAEIAQIMASLQRQFETPLLEFTHSESLLGFAVAQNKLSRQTYHVFNLCTSWFVNHAPTYSIYYPDILNATQLKPFVQGRPAEISLGVQQEIFLASFEKISFVIDGDTLVPDSATYYLPYQLPTHTSGEQSLEVTLLITNKLTGAQDESVRRFEYFVNDR